MVLFSTVAISQPQLTWRFANAQLINGDTQLQFDVEVMGDAAGWYIYIAQLGFSYNELAFGSNINGSGAVTIERGVLFTELYLGALEKYQIISIGDPFSNTLGATVQTQLAGFFGSSGGDSHTEWPTDWTQAFIVTIDIANSAEPYDIDWWYVGMNGQQSCQTGFPLTVELCVNPNLYELWPSAAGDEWTGDAGTDWNDDGNWLDGSYPTLADDVLIPAGVTSGNYPDFGGYEAECNNLEIESGASVTIQTTGGLNAAGVVLCDGEFMMYSDAGFRNGGIDPLSAGTFLFDRLIEPYPAGNEFLGWHYIASPITGFENWDIYNYWVNWWNEPAAGDPDFPWVHMEGSPTIPCDPAPLMAIGDMEGWSVKQDYDYLCNATNPGTDDHILFQGDFADVHADVDYTRAYTNTGGHSAQGYNLMGNPYPSWIDMTDFTGLNVHIWDGSADTYLNWAGGGDFTEIPPTQGFFVYEGLPGTPLAGDLTIAKANTVYGTQAFQKSEMNEVVLLATGNDKQDKTYIRFSEEATAAYDNSGIDAYKLFGSGTAPQIYTVTNGEEFSINTLDETPVVPMSFFAAQSAEYTIEAIETGEFANVVLEDRFTGEQTDLLTDSYTFSYTVNDGAERFFVHFTPLGIGEDLAASIDIWSNDHKIYVQAPAINGDIVVFNMMGQEVIRTEIEPGLNTIPVYDNNSYYIVKVISSDVARTGKVYVK